jgi:hypothetical protein
MNRHIWLILLFLSSAIAAGVIIGLVTNRPPDTLLKSADKEQAQLTKPDKWNSPSNDTGDTSEKEQSLAGKTIIPDTPPSETNASPALDEHVYLDLAKTDPATAVRLVRKLDPEQRPRGLLENLVQQWASSDLPAATVWVKQEPPGEERDLLLQRVAFMMSHTNPAAAGKLVVEEIAPGPLQEEATMTVLHQWMQHDFAGAKQWVNLFPESPLRTRAENELAGWTPPQQASNTPSQGSNSPSP